jgi:putative flippase GtrA
MSLVPFASCVPFVAVGAIGFLLQIASLAALTSLAHWAWLPATFVSVELTLLHNFLWHERWTFRERTAARVAPSAPWVRFVRFHLANGLMSMLGNLALMALFAGRFGWPAVPVNALAVAAMSVANFVVADRWVFPARSAEASATAEAFREGGRTRPTYAVLMASALALSLWNGELRAEPRLEPSNHPDTVAAWERYVAATEARLERSRAPAVPSEGATDVITAWGESVRAPSGTISDWRGAVFIRGITLDRLLHDLQHPGTPPPQEDVVSSRVIAREGGSLRVAVRLVRRAIVTVTYDTEHEMRFHRRTPTLATARSVATRIDEVGGADHGFLWRLHSYWRYEETSEGVLVELESLTLSRDVPAIVRPIASPIVNHIARESMIRTLEALKRHMSG